MPSYRFADFYKRADLIIDPDLQRRTPNPFTMTVAKRFFDNFWSATFEFDGPVGFVFVDDGNMALPNRSWASGNLCAEAIADVQRTGEEPTAVARVFFECGGACTTPIIRVEAIRRVAPEVSARDHYERAMDANNPDVTIKELDACLCANPEPFLAMVAYFNLSAAVWDKFGFNNRRSDTVEDDEYVWVRGCNIFLRRALKIYENMPRHQQLEADPLRFHQAVKESLGPTVHYGAYVFRFGQREFRKVSGLPPLRCLTEIKMDLDR